MEIYRTKNGVMQLRGDLHISNAQELRKSLLDELTSAPAVILELSEVDTCDAASLQLLCSAKTSAELHGKVFGITGPSAVLVDTCGFLGLPLKTLTSAPIH